MRPTLPVLALASLLVLGGCLAGVGPAGTGTPNSTTPIPEPTPVAGCDPVDPQTVDPYRDNVEPSDLPERPAELTRESVESYVVAFEKAWARNQRLSEDSKQVNTMVTVEAVDADGDAWTVQLTSRTNTWAQGTATGTKTATVVHGDGPYVPVRYRVTDAGLFRLEDATGDRSPVEAGVAVACFDG